VKHALLALFLVACGDDDALTDAGRVDAGRRDGGPRVDGGTLIDGGADAGIDAGVDAGGIDAGRPDAGRPDAGRDGGGVIRFDAGTPFDAGVPDSGTPFDAGLPDAGTPFDAGGLDAGPVPVEVAMTGMVFIPAAITVPPGTVVRWRTTGGTHSSTSDTGLWDSGLIGVGGAPFERRFDTPGTFPYYCSLHGGVGFGMRGTVTVAP
jgi:plastocyanin